MSQQGFPFHSSSAGSMRDVNHQQYDLILEEGSVDETQSSDPRRDGTKHHVDRLYQLTLIQRPGERIVLRKGGRKNKNEILGLTLARLVKEKHLSGGKFSEQVELTRSIPMRINSRGFVMILNLQGRVVAMSDEVEHHLGKSMRSIYTQCINIFQCLNETDAARLKSIFDTSSNLVQKEHRLVCTLHLPKGKRPSRTHEDIKTVMMCGHFYSHHEAPQEKLFIARCEGLISPSTNKSNSSQTSILTSNQNSTHDHIISLLKITLKDNMTIDFVSSNVRDILGYSGNEMMGNWFGRYIPREDLAKFEDIRQRCFQEQLPTSAYDLFDIYANHGQSRLTFLCQVRPIRERRAKTIKFHVVAQLIDPSLRDEYMAHIQVDTEPSPSSIPIEQVNHVSLSSSSIISETSEDPILVNSPSLDRGLLIFDKYDINNRRKSSPFNRSLSNVAPPLDATDRSWEQLFELDYQQHSTNDEFSSWSTKYFDEIFNQYQPGRDLEDRFNDYFDEYLH